jgi:hypothetical protein
MATSNTEGRIVRLETLWRSLQRSIASLTTRADGQDALARQSSGVQYNWDTPGGGGTTVWFCLTPSSSSWTGTALPGGSPVSFVADVYKLSGGAYSLVTASATVYNGYLSSPANSKMVTVGANGDGSYTLIGESCL